VLAVSQVVREIATSGAAGLGRTQSRQTKSRGEDGIEQAHATDVEGGKAQ
jgi:hypothetical protein